MKMNQKNIFAILLTTTLIASIATGCGNSNEKSQASSASTANLNDSAWQEAITTPFGKYPELINYTLGKTAVSYTPLAGTEYENDNDTNNAFTRYFKEKLNVQNVNTFEATDGDDYNQKVSMAVVSGDIPDIMVVPDYDTLKQLYDNDLLADLTESYENCASDRIKEIYDSYEGRCLDTAKFDGKLMALPTTEITHGPGVLWLRKDWMDKLGLSDPKTLEDVENIITQFIEKDPGGNGTGKTVGLVTDTEIAGITGGNYQLNNIFTFFGAYPKQWIDDGSGKAVYGSVQPEIKEALTEISSMYKNGLIDQQLAVRTGDDRKSLLVSGQSGSFFDNWWGSWTVADSITLNSEANWVPYVCPQSEDGSVTMFTGNPNSSYIVVRKGYEHPEVAAKMVSLQYDYERYQDIDQESLKELNDYSDLNVSGSPIATNIDYFDAFLRSAEDVSKALDSGDSSKLNSFTLSSYNSYKKYLDSVKAGEPLDVNAWAGYTSSITCANLVNNSNIKEINPVFFGTTSSMTQKWPTLEKMEQEMYLKIITGEDSPDAFDTFVESWNKVGGEQITKEVNDALKAKK